LKFDHSLPIEGAGGFRTARWSLVLLAAQKRAPDSRAVPLQAEQEIHARCEALMSFPEQWNSVQSACSARVLLAALSPASLLLPRLRWTGYPNRQNSDLSITDW
jgi:hypothetical protein